MEPEEQCSKLLLAGDDIDATVTPQPLGDCQNPWAGKNMEKPKLKDLLNQPIKIDKNKRYQPGFDVSPAEPAAFFSHRWWWLSHDQHGHAGHEPTWGRPADLLFRYRRKALKCSVVVAEKIARWGVGWGLVQSGFMAKTCKNRVSREKVVPCVWVCTRDLFWHWFAVGEPNAHGFSDWDCRFPDVPTASHCMYGRPINPNPSSIWCGNDPWLSLSHTAESYEQQRFWGEDDDETHLRQWRLWRRWQGQCQSRGRSEGVVSNKGSDHQCHDHAITGYYR